MNDLFSCQCQSRRLREDIAYLFRNDCENDEYSSKKEELQELNEKIKYYLLVTAEQLVVDLTKFVQVGIVCGPHWANEPNPFDYAKNNTFIKYGIALNWTDEDSSCGDDWFSLFVSVVNPEPKRITSTILLGKITELLNCFPKLELAHNLATVSFVGNYRPESGLLSKSFCHLNILSSDDFSNYKLTKEGKIPLKRN